jgi:hypothetical protein
MGEHQMRAFMRIAAVTAAAGLFLAPAVGAASAAATNPKPHLTHVLGGSTHVTTAPGIAHALLANGIVPIATSPATSSLTAGGNLRFAFPVTSGSVGLVPPSGHINHAGGILFFKSLAHNLRISSLRISLASRVLSAKVSLPGNPRVPIFKLDLSHAVVHHTFHSVTVSHIGLKLTAPAAAALDAALVTTAFHPGMTVGTGSTTLRI